MIDYSELKPTKCTWADGNEKMPSNKGHNIPQSKCFTKYLEEKNYDIFEVLVSQYGRTRAEEYFDRWISCFAYEQEVISFR